MWFSPKPRAVPPFASADAGNLSTRGQMSSMLIMDMYLTFYVTGDVTIVTATVGRLLLHYSMVLYVSSRNVGKPEARVGNEHRIDIKPVNKFVTKKFKQAISFTVVLDVILDIISGKRIIVIDHINWRYNGDTWRKTERNSVHIVLESYLGQIYTIESCHVMSYQLVSGLNIVHIFTRFTGNNLLMFICAFLLCSTSNCKYLLCVPKINEDWWWANLITMPRDSQSHMIQCQCQLQHFVGYDSSLTELNLCQGGEAQSYFWIASVAHTVSYRKLGRFDLLYRNLIIDHIKGPKPRTEDCTHYSVFLRTYDRVGASGYDKVKNKTNGAMWYHSVMLLTVSLRRDEEVNVMIH